MTDKGLVFCGWCGIGTILLTAIGLGPLAQMTPPPGRCPGEEDHDDVG